MRKNYKFVVKPAFLQKYLEGVWVVTICLSKKEPEMERIGMRQLLRRCMVLLALTMVMLCGCTEVSQNPEEGEHVSPSQISYDSSENGYIINEDTENGEQKTDYCLQIMRRNYSEVITLPSSGKKRSL